MQIRPACKYAQVTTQPLGLILVGEYLVACVGPRGWNRNGSGAANCTRSNVL